MKKKSALPSAFFNLLSGFERWKRDQLSRDRVKCAYDLLLPGARLQWVCYRPQFQREKCTDVALRSEPRSAPIPVQPPEV